MSRHWTLAVTEPCHPVRRGGRLLPRGPGWFWLTCAGQWSCYRFRSWHGLQRVWRGRERSGDFPDPAAPGYRGCLLMKQKTVAAADDGRRHIAAMETEVMRDHLALVEHLAVTRYEDGQARQPGYITIRTQGQAWVADVKDPDSCCSFRLLATTLDELLESLQELLGADQAPWEPDQWLRANQAKAKKK